MSLAYTTIMGSPSRDSAAAAAAQRRGGGLCSGTQRRSEYCVHGRDSGKRSRDIFNPGTTTRDPDMVPLCGMAQQTTDRTEHRADHVTPDYRPRGRRSTGQWGVFSRGSAGRPDDVTRRQEGAMTTTTTPSPRHHHHHHHPPLLLPSPLSPRDPGGCWAHRHSPPPPPAPPAPSPPPPSSSTPRYPVPSPEAFSAAISQMYSGLPANPLLPRHGVNAPISTEQLRSRVSGGRSQTPRRGPLRADHSLHTPRSATDREIEDINRSAAEEATRRFLARATRRPLSAQLIPTYFSDLTDDTDPRSQGTGSPGDPPSPFTQPRAGSGRRKRVYRIKRPRSAPVYGRISPVSGGDGGGPAPTPPGDSSSRGGKPGVNPETLSSPRGDSGLSSELTWSRVDYGSVDSLLLGLDTDTNPRAKKSKSKKSFFKSWFSAKKGKYIPDTLDRMEKSPTQKVHSDSASTDKHQNTNMLSSAPHNVRNHPATTESGPQSQRSVDSTSPEESRSSGAGGTVFSLLSSEVLKGGATGAYENTTVKFNTNVTRHEVITIKGSAHNATDRSIMLNDSGFPQDLASTFKAKPVMVRERKVSSGSSQDLATLTTFTGRDADPSLGMAELDPQGMANLSFRHGAEDQELLSTASKIAQSQRSDGVLEDPADDDHELVVIREYVFAARKTSTDREFPIGTTPSEEAKTLPPSIASASSGSVGSVLSAMSPVREHDSGLDSPPSLQESLPPPVKPKRSGRASKELHDDETQTPGTDHPENNKMTEKSPLSTEKVLPQPAAVKGTFGKSEGSSQDPVPKTFVSTFFAHQQNQHPDTVGGFSDAFPENGATHKGDNKSPSSSLVPAEKMPKTLLAAEGNPVDLYAIPDKTQKKVAKENKGNSGSKVAQPPTKHGPTEDKNISPTSRAKDVAQKTAMIIERSVQPSQVSTLQSSVPPQREKAVASLESPVHSKQVKEEVDLTQTEQDNPQFSDRLSRYRDSLTDEAYNKPWDNDFSSIEENLRSKITLTFPSAREKDEEEQTDPQGETNTTRQDSLPPAGKRSVGKSDNKDSGPGQEKLPANGGTSVKDSAENSTHSKPVQQSVESLGVKHKDGTDSTQNTEAVVVPTAAARRLTPATTPRKTSAQFERPLLPQPPPPPIARTSGEDLKPAHAEKLHKSSTEEKGSPLNHRKLKEKFKKVFSHSSEDKKTAKADHKKSTPLMKKKETVSPKPEDDKASDGEHQKETDNTSTQPDDTEMKPSDGDEAQMTADHHNTLHPDNPEHDYMSPKSLTFEPDTAEDSNDPGPQDDADEYTSVGHEVKLPFPPKEAKKLMKAEKKNTAKPPPEEGKDSPTVEDSKVGSPRAPNRALKWIRKKLATKGKKTPHSKKYTISGPDEVDADEEDVSSKETKCPRPSDTNSPSEDSYNSNEDSHDSSESPSDSDQDEGKRMKSPRKVPFWSGKKDKKKKKKKATHLDSDSDSSTEESKSTLFSWSLGRKKTADSSDHEDNLPASYKRSADWTPEDESTGVSGTFRKISDDAPQNQDQTHEKPSARDTKDQQLDPDKKRGVKITASEASTNSKVAPDDESSSSSSSNSENAAKDSSQQPGSESYRDVNSEPATKKENQKLKPPYNKMFSLDESDEPRRKDTDGGDHAKLREGAKKEKVPEKTRKQAKGSGYVLARPLFLEDGDTPSADVEDTGSQTEGTEPKHGKGRSDDVISEDSIVPTKAARPVHQALKALDSLTKQEPLKTGQDSKPSPSPAPDAKQKRVTFAKPSPKPKPKQVKKEVEDNRAVEEEEIVASKAEDAFRRHTPSSGSTPEITARKGDADKTDDQVDVSLDVDITHPSPLPDIDQHVLPDNAQNTSVQSSASTEDSPRSNADSDNCEGRTYLDKPGFLDVAKASWNLQGSKPLGTARAKSDPSGRDIELGKHTVTDPGVSAARKKADAEAHASVTPGGQEDSSSGFTATAEKAEKASSMVTKPLAQTVSDDPFLKSSPNTSRRKTRAVTPSELKSAKLQEASLSAEQLKSGGETPSKTADQNESPIDWLDSASYTTSPNIHRPRPEKPSVPPKVFAKPKIFKSKGEMESRATKPKQEGSAQESVPEEDTLLPSESPRVQAEVRPGVSVTPTVHMAQKDDRHITKPAVEAKPTPPPVGSKPTPPGKPNKSIKFKSPGTASEVRLTSPDNQSPEPKPRKFLKDMTKHDAAQDKQPKADSFSEQQAKQTPQHSTSQREATPLLSSDDSQEGRFTDPSTSSWGEDSVTSEGPQVGDFTLALKPRAGGGEGTGRSTGKRGETTNSSTDSQVGNFTLGLKPRAGEGAGTDPQVGDFTLGLEPRTGESESEAVPSHSEANQSTDDTTLTATFGQNQRSLNSTESGSEFTDVTQLMESQTNSRLTPLSQSTPLTLGPVTSASTSVDVTVSSVSTISEAASVSDTSPERCESTISDAGPVSDTGLNRRESDIYEPIFFDDPRTSRPTEAPPVRPEKVGKRNTLVPRIVSSDYDDDPDSTYDVPRTHQTFAFPRESSLPVVSIVDKRSSKTSLKSIRSLEPEDSIAPYATCHRGSRFMSETSDCEDDHNPYVNEDEDLHSLSSSRSQSTERPDESRLTEEVVHGSFKELFPEASTDGAAPGNASASEEPRPDDTDQGESGVPDTPDQAKHDKMFSIGLSSSDTSSSTSSDEEGTASSKPKKRKAKNKPKKTTTDTVTVDTKTAQTQDDEDQYLKSPEYKHSVDEINKLYAALEKEEREMEKQSASRKPQSSDHSTKPPTHRLLSFEEQRAELKPLKPKLEDPPAELTLTAEKHKAPQTQPNVHKKTKDETSDTTDPNPVRKNSSASTELPAMSAQIPSKDSPQGSPSLPKGSKNKAQKSEPERAHMDDRELREDARGSSSPKMSAFHRLAEIFKPGVKRTHSKDKEDGKVKVTPEEPGKGKEGADEEGGRGHGTSPDDKDDFSTFQLELPGSSTLEAEVMQHHPPMYAQVLKTGAPTKEDTTRPTTTTTSTSEPSPPVAGSPSTAKKTSTLSSFFITKGRPLEHPGHSTDTEVEGKEASHPQNDVSSPQTTRAAKTAVNKTSSGAGAFPTEPLLRSTAQQDKDKDTPDSNKDGPATESTVSTPAETTDTMSAENAPSLKSSPEASPPKADQHETPIKSGVPSPGAADPPGTPEVSEPPGTKPKPQPKPRDLTRTYSDVDRKSGASVRSETGISEQSGQPEVEGQPEVKSQPEVEGQPEVPNRHSSLLSPDSFLPSPAKDLPDSPHGHKHRTRVHGAAALSESEWSEEEDTEEEEEGQEGGDSPPVPERKYREAQDSKYNEYSNVIRVDSTKLKEARMRSLSRTLLTEDPPDKKDKAASRLRNALSLEGGLDKKSKKRKKSKGSKEEGGGGERKAKKPFILRSFKDLFARKKKGKGRVEEARGEEEGEANVYEVVDDMAPQSTSKNPTTTTTASTTTASTTTASSSPTSTTPANKHTWPKHKKRKKSDRGERPPSTHQQHPPLIAVDSSHADKDIRPIGRLLQLNPDGTQLLELIRPPHGQLGVQLTQGNEETLQGKFVSGFVDRSTQKLLSGILHIGDQILRINDRSIDDCPLIEVHDIIDSQQRLKFLVLPTDSH
ncbi:uncharacterized protein LOC143276079 [Babylonia areolata]|uniref:uncharacterized protein LOC143276079 n=1 Tax=Babylonia areolata TaxID=304850 RepID=UPI003FD0C40B